MGLDTSAARAAYEAFGEGEYGFGDFDALPADAKARWQKVAAAVCSSPTREQVTEVLPLTEIRRRVRNIWGAISSNQVIDKDVEGQAKQLLADIDAAISPSPTGGEAEALVERAAKAFVEHLRGSGAVVWEEDIAATCAALEAAALTRPAPLMDEVKAVLRPIAILAEATASRDPDDGTVLGVSIGHVRRARALLTKLQEGGR